MCPWREVKFLVNRCLRSLRWSLHQEDQWDHAAADNAEILEDIDITQDAGLCLQRSVDKQNRFGLSIGHSGSAAQQVAGERSSGLEIYRGNSLHILPPKLLGDLLMTCPHRRKEGSFGTAPAISWTI